MDLQRGARVWMVTMTTIYADVSITLAVNVVRSAALVLFRRSGDQDMAMMHLFVNRAIVMGIAANANTASRLPRENSVWT